MTQVQLFRQKRNQTRDPRLDEKVPVAEMEAWLDDFARSNQTGPYKPQPRRPASELEAAAR